MNTQTFTITREVTLTDDDIRDIPFGMGTDYWGMSLQTHEGYDVFVYDDYGRTGGYRDHFVAYDEIRKTFGQLVTGVNDDGKPFEVNSDIMSYFRNAVFDGENGGVELGHIDTDAADVLMQIAIWGELIYG